MATYDWTGTDIIPNGSGSAVRADLNDALLALFSQNSSAAPGPPETVAYMPWADTTNGLYKIRNAANSDWITLYQLDGEWTTIALENGTAAAPSLYFKDSGTDTGIYSPGTDQVAIATAGVQRVNFNGATEVVFNDGGADVDFRIEGDTEPNLFKIDAGTDQVQVANLNGGPLAGARNRIINGNFDIWQRGTSTGAWAAPISNYYLPDRWVFSSGGTGGTGSLTQQAFTAGQTDVPGEPTYFMRWQITSAASGQTTGGAYVEQRIEDVRTLAGQTATISFYAKGTGTLPNIYLTQTFGSGGSAQVQYTLASSVALNASWTKYTYTVNVGSISGKTIGSNHYVGLAFMVPINSTYTLDLAQVQVEPGSTATPFERRSYGQELALCQRYYYKLDGFNFAGYNVAGGGNIQTVSIPNMRATPSASFYGTSTVSNCTGGAGSGNPAGATTAIIFVYNIATGGFQVSATAGNGYAYTAEL